MPALLERPQSVAVARGRAMPLKTTRLVFDDDGYPEWYAIVRTNVRGSVMDDYRSGEDERWWKAISVIVREWNFCDEDGVPIPLPSEGTTSGDLPEDLLATLMAKFREAFNAQAQPPKEPSASSTPISTTSP